MRGVIDEQGAAIAFSGFFPARCRLFQEFDPHSRRTIRRPVPFRGIL
jgi:hypothetical protein